MTKWNQAIQTMHEQCKEIGKDRCLMVFYEQLVLHPELEMRKILGFLDIPWNESVLHHEEFINKENGVALSKWVFMWSFAKTFECKWSFVWKHQFYEISLVNNLKHCYRSELN